MYTPPKITVEIYGRRYALFATSHGRSSLAGPRILRAEPWPEVKFVHDDRASAEKDAELLRTYLAECASGKRKESAQNSRRGWWQD